jgi:hypothetical protein
MSSVEYHMRSSVKEALADVSFMLPFKTSKYVALVGATDKRAWRLTISRSKDSLTVS